MKKSNKVLQICVELTQKIKGSAWLLPADNPFCDLNINIISTNLNIIPCASLSSNSFSHKDIGQIWMLFPRNLSEF